MRFKVKTSDVEVLNKYGFHLPEKWLSSGALKGTNVSEGCMMDVFTSIKWMKKTH